MGKPTATLSMSRWVANKRDHCSQISKRTTKTNSALVAQCAERRIERVRFDCCRIPKRPRFYPGPSSPTNYGRLTHKQASHGVVHPHGGVRPRGNPIAEGLGCCKAIRAITTCARFRHHAAQGRLPTLKESRVTISRKHAVSGWCSKHLLN
jgi:hypothetical protein